MNFYTLSQLELAFAYLPPHRGCTMMVHNVPGDVFDGLEAQARARGRHEVTVWREPADRESPEILRITLRPHAPSYDVDITMWREVDL